MQIICCCTSDQYFPGPIKGVTVGKIYDATAAFDGDYFIIYCDDNKARWAPKELFITVEQHRNIQIEEICK